MYREWNRGRRSAQQEISIGRYPTDHVRDRSFATVKGAYVNATGCRLVRVWCIRGEGFEKLNLQILVRQEPRHFLKMSEQIMQGWKKVLTRNSERLLLCPGGLS